MRCYYHNDLDGRCAGAIVYAKYKGWKGQFIETNYTDTIDVGAIENNEQIIIVDFSFKPEVMEKVLKITKNIIWIDHHKTASEYTYSQELKGLRNNDYSGCELAWRYLYPDEEMPRAVELIGDRDKWAFKFGKETAWFNLGLQLYPHQPKDAIWDKLLLNKPVGDIIEKGKICEQFRDNFCKDYADSYGFETMFEGYKCFALGLYMFGREAFGERFKQYDICLSFESLGDKWIIGLYSENVDVSMIAKKYDGGGHKGAAGFVCDVIPFCNKLS